MPDLPRVANSRPVHAGRVLQIRVDEVEMPNGTVTAREVVHHPGAVAMVPVRKDGQLLLVTQYRHAMGARLLEIPAGTLEPGEDPLLAAGRELREEVGFRAGRVDYVGKFYVAPGYCDELLHLYICRDLEADSLDADDDEDIEVEAMTLDEALQAIAEERIVDAKSIIGILQWSRLAAGS